MPTNAQFEAEADDAITSIDILLHTAATSSAGTDSDIFISFFTSATSGQSAWFEIDTDGFDDFEAGQTKSYKVTPSYFSGRLITDIRRITLEKADGWGSDWGFGWLVVRVNGDWLYASKNYASQSESVDKWLPDGKRWDAATDGGDFVPMDIQAPMITSPGLRDASSNELYSFDLSATGGRKPLKWTIESPAGAAFVSGPSVQSMNAKGTKARISGKTATTNTVIDWAGVLVVTDAENNIGKKLVNVRVIKSLPPPTIAKVSPSFGWAAAPPADPEAVILTIESSAHDFDSRSPTATRVFFRKDGSEIEGTLVPGELVNNRLKVRIPAGATTGVVRVQTAFGSALSPKVVVVHPHGYRFTKGFSFVNRAEDTGDDGFPSTFAWARYEETYGLDEMWLVVFDQAIVPNPIATHFYLTSQGLIGNGCCHGFSLLSLQISKGVMAPAFAADNNAYPLATATWNLSGSKKPSTGLSNAIQNRQLVVWSDEGLSYFLNALDTIPNVGTELCKMDARPALKDVSLDLAKGLKNPRMICFAANCWPFKGHVVVPYAIEGGDHIRVYDPNRPGRTGNADDHNSFFDVKLSDGSWSYDKSTKTEESTWSGVYMFTVPLSAYGHQFDWSLPGIGTLLGTAGTFMLGSAATDEEAQIVQVADSQGRALFTKEGRFNPNRTQWPLSARVVPTLSEGVDRPTIAITRPGPVTFTVKPRAETSLATSRLFSIIRSANCGLSIEDFGTTVNAEFDGTTDSLAIRPVGSPASLVARICRRLPETVEYLTWAVRLNGLSADTPIKIHSSADRRGLVVASSAAPLQLDIELVHGARTGQVRAFECHAVAIPPGSTATFSVSDIELIDQVGAAPVTLTIHSTGSATVQHLAADPSGLRLVAPDRIITRPKIVIQPQPEFPAFPVAIDVSKSTSGFNQAFHVRAIGQASDYANGKVTVRLTRGTHVVRLIAEDASGHRSFPKTVHVTVPGEDTHIVGRSTVLFEDVVAQPGTTLSMPVSAYFADEPVHKVTVTLNLRQRRSGHGVATPRFLSAFVLSEASQALGATASAVVRAAGALLDLTLTWPIEKARGGRIDLGTITIEVPNDVAFGSAFFLRGVGTIELVQATTLTPTIVNVLPGLVRVWGGVEPATLGISAPNAVAESGSVEVHLNVSGVLAPSVTSGWWLENFGGRAALTETNDPFVAHLAGVRAGFIRVWAVVGTKTASALVRVTPTVD
jgi:hypothetical protein